MVGESLKEVEDLVADELPPPTGSGREHLLSTGSTLLNLACSGCGSGGLSSGKFYLIVGDASAGKTFLAMTCLAEACVDQHYSNHRFIYDNIEDGCLLDIQGLFNSELARRLEPPSGTREEPEYSETVEGFYFNVDDAIQKGEPFIYVLDSMDALTSDDEDAGFKKKKAAARSGQETSGSYGVSKARKNSEGLRRILRGLRSTESFLIILCQTRDDLGPGFAQKTRSGGHALRFYATIEIWASIKSTLKKNIKGKDRPIGVQVLWKVKKNRLIGALNSVTFAIYPSYGIDDIGSCIDYLVSEGWWQQVGLKVKAVEFELTASREKLVSAIEEKGLTGDMRVLVDRCWNEIMTAGKVKRRGRYRIS